MRIAECGLKNPKSQIQNPKSDKSGRLPETFCQLDVSRKSIGGKQGIFF
jgi:hypothetical protein